MSLSPVLGLVDAPGTRKYHNGKIAIAGWALVLAFTVGAIAFVSFSRELVGLWLGSLIAAATGLLDDLRDLSPRQKLWGQLLAALVATLASPWVIESIRIIDIEIALGWLAIPFTVFWIVGAMNALNLLDGLDGLAAGAAAIISGASALLAWQSENLPVLILSLALSGAALGFLYYNFCPARVFMGDTGSHFLGYWLAILSVQATQPGLASPTQAPLLISVLLLGLPIIDTGWAILRRVRAHRSITAADRGHIHYRLLSCGWTCTKTVLVLCGAIAILCLSAIALYNAQI
jgi:UDP-GlcNAc:undecaprenyl-phosphate GlcNAc-1-phosphate transferase